MDREEAIADLTRLIQLRMAQASLIDRRGLSAYQAEVRRLQSVISGKKAAGNTARQNAQRHAARLLRMGARHG